MFCQRGGGSLSLRHLTPEQMFIKAYGCLFGLSELGDKTIGINLMKSIIKSYGTDLDFINLKRDVTLELLSHFYRSNQPELFFDCFKLAVESKLEYECDHMGPIHIMPVTSKMNMSIFHVLFSVYQEKWHTEILCRESELSFLIFKKCYKYNFEEEWSSKDTVARSVEKQTAIDSFDLAEEKKPVGKICFNNHSAHLQQSDKDDRCVDLIVDGRRVPGLSLDIFGTEPASVSLAYDEKTVCFFYCTRISTIIALRPTPSAAHFGLTEI